MGEDFSLSCKRVFADEEAIETSILAALVGGDGYRKRVFADEEAIETFPNQSESIIESRCKRVFADEEAIETQLLDDALPGASNSVREYSLMKKRLRLSFGDFFNRRVHGKRVFADEEAIETLKAKLLVKVCHRKRVFADEEAIETSVARWPPAP